MSDQDFILVDEEEKRVHRGRRGGQRRAKKTIWQ